MVPHSWVIYPLLDLKGAVLTVQKRLRLGISYVSLAVAGSLAAPAVQAGDAVISTAVTTPVATSRADGTSPGNLTLTPEGSIKVSSGPAATIDSSHTFTNNGTIEVTNESRALGLLVTTSDANGAARPITGDIFDNGTINVPGPAQSSALWPEYVFNTGIDVTGAGPFNGSITRTAGSTLTVGGNGATGIAIATTMNGSLLNDGTIKTPRQDSYGIKATGAISGSLNHGGLIEATGQDGIGIYAGGDVGGAQHHGAQEDHQIGLHADRSSPARSPREAAIPPLPRCAAAAPCGSRATRRASPWKATASPRNWNRRPRSRKVHRAIRCCRYAEALYVGPGGLNPNRSITISALAGNANSASIVNRGNIAVE